MRAVLTFIMIDVKFKYFEAINNRKKCVHCKKKKKFKILVTNKGYREQTPELKISCYTEQREQLSERFRRMVSLLRFSITCGL